VFYPRGLQVLQQQLQHMQATYLLNTEKLEYNFRVLTEKYALVVSSCVRDGLAASSPTAAVRVHAARLWSQGR
jgi:hypothetical protein